MFESFTPHEHGVTKPTTVIIKNIRIAGSQKEKQEVKADDDTFREVAKEMMPMTGIEIHDATSSE